MKSYSTIIVVLLLLACTSKNQGSKELSIKGNWYADLESRTNPSDIHDLSISGLTSNYCEYYISDSTITYCEGSSLLGYDEKYFIKGDSIYKCVTPDKGCVYIPMYKIEGLHSDTLRLTIHPKYSNNRPSIFWVRLPKGELGVYDHSWADTSKYESLFIEVYSDFSRRKQKYNSSKGI